jgi:DNA polymerase III alpha subunit (gram-positive type)
MEWIVIVVLACGVLAYFRYRRKPIDLSILPERFVVFDLETTGLDSAKHEIIEIGAVRVNRDFPVHDTTQRCVERTRRTRRERSLAQQMA